MRAPLTLRSCESALVNLLFLCHRRRRPRPPRSTAPTLARIQRTTPPHRCLCIRPSIRFVACWTAMLCHPINTSFLSVCRYLICLQKHVLVSLPPHILSNVPVSVLARPGFNDTNSNTENYRESVPGEETSLPRYGRRSIRKSLESCCCFGALFEYRCSFSSGKIG